MEAELKVAPGEKVRQGLLINFWRYLLKILREKFTLLFGKKKQTT